MDGSNYTCAQIAAQARQARKVRRLLVTRILYVEDNDDNVDMMKIRLELLEGFEVLVAENGQVGCETATAKLPDLIPDGPRPAGCRRWEATRRLKGSALTGAIPIIALTAHAMAGSREKALAARCDDFDTKPAAFDRLLQKISRLLASRNISQ